MDLLDEPDLTGRALGGAVVAADDESFAAEESLVLPHPAVTRSDVGHRGKEYDGWETRRRRSPGHDWRSSGRGLTGDLPPAVRSLLDGPA